MSRLAALFLAPMVAGTLALVGTAVAKDQSRAGRRPPAESSSQRLQVTVKAKGHESDERRQSPQSCTCQARAEAAPALLAQGECVPAR